jgi:hypothetical protein
VVTLETIRTQRTKKDTLTASSALLPTTRSGTMEASRAKRLPGRGRTAVSPGGGGREALGRSAAGAQSPEETMAIEDPMAILGLELLRG